MEPLDEQGSEYRMAAVRLATVLEAVYHFTHTSRNKTVATQQWAMALGLPSVRGQSVTQVAHSLNVSKQDLSKGITRFLSLANLEPAFGLKSDKAKLSYRARPCKPKP